MQSAVITSYFLQQKVYQFTFAPIAFYLKEKWYFQKNNKCTETQLDLFILCFLISRV